MFGFDSWTVLVHDYPDGGRMSDGQRSQWAERVTGLVTDIGFLELLAEPPVSFAETGDGSVVTHADLPQRNRRVGLPMDDEVWHNCGHVK